MLLETLLFFLHVLPQTWYIKQWKIIPGVCLIVKHQMGGVYRADMLTGTVKCNESSSKPSPVIITGTHCFVSCGNLTHLAWVSHREMKKERTISVFNFDLFIGKTNA